MSIETPLRELISVRGRQTPEFDEDLMYGIELEYENVRTDMCPALWNMVGDGSLRNNGMEFVSRTLTREQLPEAIDTMEEFLPTIAADANLRCGIHVHLNMRPRTVGELYAFITGFTLLEPAIFQEWCPDRVTSSFCVPVYLNRHMQMHLHRSIQEVRRGSPNPMRHATSTSKYSALNIACLPRFCTAEVRLLPSTTDMDELREWVELLTRLYDRTTRFGDPLQVLALYERQGFLRFAASMLGQEVERPAAQQQAEVAATVIAGFEEPTWQDLTWVEPQEDE
jgi:hypothetical protein